MASPGCSAVRTLALAGKFLSCSRGASRSSSRVGIIRKRVVYPTPVLLARRLISARSSLGSRREICSSSGRSTTASSASSQPSGSLTSVRSKYRASSSILLCSNTFSSRLLSLVLSLTVNTSSSPRYPCPWQLAPKPLRAPCRSEPRADNALPLYVPGSDTPSPPDPSPPALPLANAPDCRQRALPQLLRE